MLLLSGFTVTNTEGLTATCAAAFGCVCACVHACAYVHSYFYYFIYCYCRILLVHLHKTKMLDMYHLVLRKGVSSNWVLWNNCTYECFYINSKSRRILRFATNGDLSDASRWHAQLGEIEKLPKFLRVSFCNV